MNTDRLKYKEITDIILRSFYEVYNELGNGFLESVYENALYIVLTGYGLCVEKQKDIPVFFRCKVIRDFKADLIVNEKVIVELKAVRTFNLAHEILVYRVTTRFLRKELYGLIRSYLLSQVRGYS